MKNNIDKTEKYSLLLTLTSGMELSWFIAALMLFMSLVAMPLLILPQAIIIFLLSTMLTLYTSKKNYRITWRLAMHTALISFFIIYAISVLSDYFYLASNRDAFETILAGPNNIREGLIWFIASIFILIFHLGGLSLARRELSYRNIAARFDLGITVFILFFIIAGAADLPNLSMMALTYSFFIFSLPAVALARYRQADTKGKFLHKHHRSAPIIIFTVFTLITGSGIALLFYPLLYQAASTGQNLIVHYGKPAADLFARIIIFFYNLRSQVDIAPPNGITGQDNVETYSPGGEQAGLPEQFLFWTLIFFVVAVIIIALYFILRLLINWLSSDSKSGQGKHGIFQLKPFIKLLYKALRTLRLFIASLTNFIGCQRSRTNESEPVYIFQRLSAWGTKSGRPRVETETPLEYAASLQKMS